MEKFLTMYQDLSAENLHLLQDVYSSDIQFIDPAHEFNGLGKLTEYFSAHYREPKHMVPQKLRWPTWLRLLESISKKKVFQ